MSQLSCRICRWIDSFFYPPTWGEGRTLTAINEHIQAMHKHGDSETKIDRYLNRQMQEFTQSLYAEIELQKMERILHQIELDDATDSEKRLFHDFLIIMSANTYSGQKLKRALSENQAWHGEAFGPLTYRAFNAVKRSIENKTWDPLSNARINQLHPLLRDSVTHFINRAEDELGINLRVTSGFRTIEEQDELYARGRTTSGEIIDIEAVVTYAKGGQSLHNYGLAFDIAEIKDGEANYDLDWERIATIGKAEGFEWGGDWLTLQDNPHFEKNFGYSLAQLIEKNTQLAKGETYITISKGELI